MVSALPTCAGRLDKEAGAAAAPRLRQARPPRLTVATLRLGSCTLRAQQHRTTGGLMFHRLIASFGAVAMAAAVVNATPSLAAADAGLQYQVVDADNAHDGGVYYRNSPAWGDSNRMTGVGGHYGETVALVCGAWGDEVGPYQNRRWHLVDNLSRPAAGRGWLPDRYLNTPNVANQLTPGEPECGATDPPSNVAPPNGYIIRPAIVGEAPRQPALQRPEKPNAIESSFQALIAGCYAHGWYNCNLLGRHYLDRSGTEQWIYMPDLIYQQRSLWGLVESSLRDKVQSGLDSARALPESASTVQSLDTGWQQYSATGANDWYFALGRFSVAIAGDIWLGPADARGVRPVQARYRMFLYDQYDFDGEDFSQFAKLVDQGRAAEFWVYGATRTVVLQTNTLEINAAALPLQW
jgi:hypothetical protein